MTTQAPLYQRIVDTISRRHAAGEFQPGDQMYSVGQTCKHFNVSATTAVRAIDELKQLGLITSIKGKGTFFRGTPRVELPTDTQADLRRIAIVSSHPGFFREGFQAGICRGVERAAVDAGLPLATHHIPLEDASGIERLPFAPTPTEGLIIYGAELTPAMFALVSAKSLRTVVIDGLVNMADCVITDNYHGMRQILDHLVDMGHRRVLLGATHPRSPNTTNENERISAFRYFAEDRQLEAAVVRGDAHDDIFARLAKPNAPTAVLFTQDTPAIDFIAAAGERGIDVPGDVSVSGFDGFALDHRDATQLTTLAIDSDGMGRSAVQLLLTDRSKQTVKTWQRQRGELHIGNTTGRAASN